MIANTEEHGMNLNKRFIYGPGQAYQTFAGKIHTGVTLYSLSSGNSVLHHIFVHDNYCVVLLEGYLCCKPVSLKGTLGSCR